MFKNKKIVPFLSNEGNVMRMLNNMSGVFSTKKKLRKMSCFFKFSILWVKFDTVQETKAENQKTPTLKKRKQKQNNWDHYIETIAMIT